jgi:predicted nuclease of restriction endonuclease-like (RecB) superfamily
MPVPALLLGWSVVLRASIGHSIREKKMCTYVSNWQVGAYLSTRLTTAAYGDRIVNQLAQWLQMEEPGLKGFDKRTLYRMKQFFDTWHTLDQELLPLVAREDYVFKNTKIEDKKIVGSLNPQSFIFPTFLSRLSWSHHVEILKQAASTEEILFYVFLSIKERYTVRDLRRQIKSGLFERQMLTKQTLTTSFDHPQQALIGEIFRDQYIFEFLDLKDPYSEYDLQKALLHRMKDFLLELGRDFIFIEDAESKKVVLSTV